MEKFGTAELRLNKNVKKGSKESLLTLFDADDRFKPIEVLVNANEENGVDVVLEGLGKEKLKLGADMEKGRKKTIMTLFWFAERSKPIEMQKDASQGDTIILNIYLA